MAEKQPDILIFMSDQHAGTIMGHAGAPVDTPNLDDLAQSGTSFRNAYTPCPLCVPARMAFVSGQSPSRTGVFVNNDTLPDTTPTFLHAMVAAGYETVLIGRMHFVGADQRHGFTKRLAEDFTPTIWGRPEKLMKSFRGEHAPTAYFIALGSGLGGGESCVIFYDRMVIEKALDYLAQPHDKPQCIVVGTYGPHFPYTAPKELYQKYKQRLSLYPDFTQYQEEFGELLWHRYMEATEEQARAAMAAYYALVEVADGQIGAVRKAFREMAEREGREHVFVYTSDHGDMNGHKGMYGKQVMFEDSARIPMLVEGDGIAANRLVRDNVSLLDFAPTVCAWGGAQPLAEFEGEPLQPYFGAELPENNERIVVSEIYETTVPHEHRFMPVTPAAKKNAVNSYGVMLRQGKFKYILYTAEDDRRVELLYDMEADPGENRSVLAEYPAEASRFRAIAEKRNNIRDLKRQQQLHARNARLFTAYDAAIGAEKGEMWTDNPPEGRLAPEI